MAPDDEQEPQPFQIPLPPPPFPHGFRPGGADPEDVLFLYHRAPDGPERDTEDIMLRKVPGAIAKRFRGAAGGRGLTHAQYLAALVGLHDAMRGLADGGNDEIAKELDRLGLATVTI